MSTFSNKKIVIALCIGALSLCNATVSIAQIERTFVRSFYLSNQTVTLNLGNDVTVETWKDTTATIRVEMVVFFENANVTYDLIRNFVSFGRYAIVSQNLGSNLVISAPNVNSYLGLNGKPVKERIRYIVRVPQNADVVKAPAKDSRLAIKR